MLNVFTLTLCLLEAMIKIEREGLKKLIIIFKNKRARRINWKQVRADALRVIMQKYHEIYTLYMYTNILSYPRKK